jgi:sugar/nucleoside kinase (ribokinase family)
MQTLAAARAAPRGAPRRVRSAPRCAATPPPPLPLRRKLVGLGSAGVDFLAAVDAYPQPDAKVRTTALEVQGGGNCANALTAAARLGLQPALFSKIGGDSNGDAIVSQLRADGVDTSALLRQAGAASPFTYIIVDQAASTRTCIHTPGTPRFRSSCAFWPEPRGCAPQGRPAPRRS